MNCFNFGSLKLFISLLFALPVENIETMSFVLVSPSHVIALKVVLIFRLSICFKIDEEILASVKINPKVVAIFGKIIPDPFAKGSGMIFPNMATTLGFIFTDANISSSILKQILNLNIKTTFNAITCDGDTSTNDMVSIFSTGKANNKEIKSFKDPKLKQFISSVHQVMLNLAKRVASDGEGATKFVTIKCINLSLIHISEPTRR